MKRALGSVFALALVLLSAFAPAASAGPAIQLSRTVIDFSHVARNFASPVQPVYVTNAGDANLEIGALTLAGARPEIFVVSGPCTLRPTLAPGEYCRADLVLHSPGTTGTVSATLSIASNAGPAPAVVSLFGLVDPNYVGVPFIVRAPEYLEFSGQSAGITTSLEFRMTNAIPIRTSPQGQFIFNFRIDSATLVGAGIGDFSLTSPCLTTKSFSVGDTCVFNVAFTPGQSGLRSAQIVFDLVGVSVPGSALTITYSLAGVGSASVPATVVEYYNASLDHYFITWLPAEIATLDAGIAIRGWARTGQTFRTHPVPGAGTTPVCRYYIPPGKGDSHFFGRGAVECADTGTKNPSFVLEDPAFMHMYLPVAGVCPAGTTRVYRAFNNRADANHRYMIDPAIRDLMVSRGWQAEGDGSDLVVMCAP